MTTATTHRSHYSETRDARGRRRSGQSDNGRQPEPVVRPRSARRAICRPADRLAVGQSDQVIGQNCSGQRRQPPAQDVKASDELKSPCMSFAGPDAVRLIAGSRL